MSGGSFDYLCHKDALPTHLLEQMAGELEALAENGVPGAASAAEETRALIFAQDHPLRDVWRAVEWWRSHDYGRDQVEKALIEFLRIRDVALAITPGGVRSWAADASGEELERRLAEFDDHEHAWVATMIREELARRAAVGAALRRATE